MADLVYPATLPTPKSAPIQSAERRLKSPEGGPREVRTIERNWRAEQRITWPAMNAAKAAIFRAWYEDDLIEGGAWFAATWPLPQGMVKAYRRFIGAPRWEYLGNGFYRVSAVMEVHARGVDPTTGGGGGVPEEQATLIALFSGMQYAAVYQAAHPDVEALGGIWNTSTAGSFVTFENDDALAQLSVAGAYAGEQSVAGTVMVNDGDRPLVAWEFVVTDEIPTMLRAFALVPESAFYGEEFLGGFALDDAFGTAVTYYTYDGMTTSSFGNPTLTIGDVLGVVVDQSSGYVYFYKNGVLAYTEETIQQSFENLVPVFTIGPYPVQLIGRGLTATTENGGAASVSVSLFESGVVELHSSDGDPTYEDWVLRPSTPVDGSETARYKIRATLLDGTVTAGSALGVWLDGDSDPFWQVDVPGNELGESESGSILVEVKLAGNDAVMASATFTMSAVSLPA